VVMAPIVPSLGHIRHHARGHRHPGRRHSVPRHTQRQTDYPERAVVPVSGDAPREWLSAR
jgi:hypothetical protein